LQALIDGVSIRRLSGGLQQFQGTREIIRLAALGQQCRQRSPFGIRLGSHAHQAFQDIDRFVRVA
jgi:hypothetical protein